MLQPDDGGAYFYHKAHETHEEKAEEASDQALMFSTTPAMRLCFHRMDGFFGTYLRKNGPDFFAPSLLVTKRIAV